MPADPVLSQNAFGLRFDWGLSGADAIVDGADVAVVVDVLSFTTTLTVAVDAGIDVIPSRWRDDRATQLAEQFDAVLAVGRSAASPGLISLCPATVRAAPAPTRLVLPSPNGSTIAHELASTAPLCVGASLRNASAVAQWIRARNPNAVTAVMAGGEKWPDGSLRPAVEDLWGAGAVIAALVDAGVADVSPEARAAASAWRAVERDVGSELRQCGSSRELAGMGHLEDVDIAAEVDSSSSVPILRGGVFVDATRA
ncbi:MULTISPECIES: 2-phosphosulfolactate phosphatase [unclassified Rhodococcus (in: high G+C Gram-positive bacteria)]|uniref:2-phosphosulfolactate phosphatase n=1 Tax=unclassified Rhodococcus (in: high G+C Gram-positive bacteria) TaxID=192944 RepID=UPI000B9C2209|nr:MULTISPECIES: 2-phosphosulfolactate phosphatase [unclassified Rhodococcus (in: high G+C Gram-positive bacteria)]OZE31655.1 2-phosphosulfolactate phosphatase [Rhodococcus sp. 05-2254-4]OZE42586.1 2-phosphosulfolactate phosphatase [Rhodococcus sp. 05-2254-3]OZE46742.1 2-phosphosulfolactate phosphatase [Rhodococcus sp. 05-2254-2]